jgi:molybdate transport system substrate-binding protein
MRFEISEKRSSAESAGQYGLMLLLAACIVLTAACSKEKAAEQGPRPLFVLSGAGLKCVLDPLAEAFTKETGIEVEYSYLCSAMLLTNLELTRQGDVFVPGAKHYFNLARQRGLVDESHMVIGGYQVPCIMVQKGNPKNIQRLEDLLAPGLRLGVGDFEAMAVGRLTKEMLTREQILEPFMENVEVVGGTAPKLCLPVCMNSIDAAINLTATAKTFDHCTDIVLIDPEKVVYSTFPVALTRYARNDADALRYFEFVQSPQARKIFAEHGFGLYFEPRPDQYVE